MPDDHCVASSDEPLKSSAKTAASVTAPPPVSLTWAFVSTTPVWLKSPKVSCVMLPLNGVGVGAIAVGVDVLVGGNAVGVFVGGNAVGVLVEVGPGVGVAVGGNAVGVFVGGSAVGVFVGGSAVGVAVGAATCTAYADKGELE